ncbi:MAG: hypothetical protein ACRD36_02150 [Candidatus Acidiferrum sp.]
MMVRPRLTIIDVIGIALIVLGIAITVLNFLAARRSIADVGTITLHEIAPRGAVNNL